MSTLDIMLADGFEEAFLGMAQRFEDDGIVKFAIYDVHECLKILQGRDGMTEEEASEYFHFNVAGSYVGKGTPAFLYSMDLENALEIAEAEREIDDGDDDEQPRICRN